MLSRNSLIRDIWDAYKRSTEKPAWQDEHLFVQTSPINDESDMAQKAHSTDDLNNQKWNNG